MTQTGFLASVSNVQEAMTILAAGADIIDIKDPRKGALGAVETDIASDIVKNIAGRVMTSATIGDLPMETDCISDAICKTQTSGVDIIKIGVFSDHLPAEIMQLIKHHAGNGYRIVLVYFADMNHLPDNFSDMADSGIYGVMLDTADKTKGSLRTILDDKSLGFFVSRAKSSGLMTGLAGSLQKSDIQPLLTHEPDYLGFRSALCDKHQRINEIDIQAVCNIRAMIPCDTDNSFNFEKLTATM